MWGICWKMIKHCCGSVVALLLTLPIVFAACGNTRPGKPLTTTSGNGASFSHIGASQHLAVSFEQPWEMSRDNSVDVNVAGVDEPMILTVELIPQFSETVASQRPSVLDGTPVADHWEEIVGYIVLYRVDTDVDSIRITYPAILFDPALYAGVNLLSWKLNVFLVLQIDAYPVNSAMAVGEKYPITVKDVQARQTWIKSEAQIQTRVGSATDRYIIVPNSTAGVFLYYPLDAVVDSIVLTGDLGFNFAAKKIKSDNSVLQKPCGLLECGRSPGNMAIGDTHPKAHQIPPEELQYATVHKERQKSRWVTVTTQAVYEDQKKAQTPLESQA